MHFPQATTSKPQHIPREMMHLIFFSILFLMLVTLGPNMSWGHGSCHVKQAQLEGPLLPVAV